jgi:DNA-binding LytR/AlgR family response regulator
MKFALICSPNLQPVLAELLKNRNIVIDDEAPYGIVESGFEPPRGKVLVLFDGNNLNHLIELLDKLAKPAESYPDGIIGRIGDERLEIVPYRKICYFEARGNNVVCVTPGGEYQVKDKLFELEEKLPAGRFIRISKSLIVNIANVKEIIPWFGRRLVLRFELLPAEIEVSKNYVRSFKEFLGF